MGLDVGFGFRVEWSRVGGKWEMSGKSPLEIGKFCLCADFRG